MELLWSPEEHGDNQARNDWLNQFKIMVWRHVLSYLGIHDDALAEHYSSKYQKIRSNHVYLYPDVLTVLPALKERYRLGLLTNGLSNLQRLKIKLTGIEHYFEHIFISCELGQGKPEKKIFNRAFNSFQVKPSSTLMIGDNIHKDIHGAINAGAQAVWVNRLKERNSTLSIYSMDKYVENLSMLLNMLEPAPFDI